MVSGKWVIAEKEMNGDTSFMLRGITCCIAISCTAMQVAAMMFFFYSNCFIYTITIE
jgi:hypothetical protein